MARRRQISDQERTAYHEAGHAVAAYETRLPILHISIIEDEDTYGRTRCGRTPFENEIAYSDVSGRTRAYVERHVIVDCGGPVAEKKLGGGSQLGSQDLQRAFEVLVYLCGSDAEHKAYFKWLYERSRNIVLLYWPAVRALAKELLEHNEMGRSRIREIIKAAMEPPAHDFEIRDLTMRPR